MSSGVTRGSSRVGRATSESNHSRVGSGTGSSPTAVTHSVPSAARP